jgi:hypothetical protein
VPCKELVLTGVCSIGDFIQELKPKMIAIKIIPQLIPDFIENFENGKKRLSRFKNWGKVLCLEVDIFFMARPLHIRNIPN